MITKDELFLEVVKRQIVIAATLGIDRINISKACEGIELLYYRLHPKQNIVKKLYLRTRGAIGRHVSFKN